MRILDLGCGKGISSILLIEKYGATVFAADLWILPTEIAIMKAEAGKYFNLVQIMGQKR